MSEQTAEDKAIAEQLGVPLTPGAPAPGAGTPIGSGTGTGDAGDSAANGDHNLEDVPDWVREELTRARREAARYRTQAREAKTEVTKTPDESAIRAQVRREFATDMAAARLESALTGLVESPADFVDLLDKAKYVTADGDVDLDAIKTLRDKFTRIVSTPSVGHGRAGGPGPRTEVDQFADVMRQIGA